MTEFHIMQNLYCLPEYKRVIQYLTNETMDQCIFTIDPAWVNPSKTSIVYKCHKVADLMGVVNKYDVTEFA